MTKGNLGLIRATLPRQDLIVIDIRPASGESLVYIWLAPSCLLKILMSFVKEGFRVVVITTSYYEIILEQTST